MARNSNQTTLTLRLIDAVSAPARLANASLKGLAATMGGMKSVSMGTAAAVSSIANSARRDANQIAVAGSLAAIGAGAAARSVYQLEKSLNVSVAAGNLSLAQRNEFMADAVRWNAEFAATSGGIVDAGNELLRAGLGYDQMRGALPGVLSTAQAMDVGMSEASAAVVNSMVSMRMAMNDTASTMASSIRIADLYAHAVNETTGSLDDFALSSRYANPVFAAMGTSPERAMAYQVALAKNGIMGSSAGTGLRSAPVSIADPSKKARQTFARLQIDPAAFVGRRTSEATGASIAGALEAAGFSAEGVEVAIDQVLADPRFRAAPAKAANEIISAIGDQIGVVTGEDRSLVSDAVQRALMAGVSEVDLVSALRALRGKGATIADFTAIFGRNHASKMMALDPDIFDRALADIEAKAAGTSTRMREAMMAGIVGDVAEFTAALEGLFVAVGRAGLLGDASRALVSLSTAIGSVADASPGLLRAGAYATLFAAALAPAGLAIAGAAAVASLAINPLVLLGGSLAGLVALNWRPLANGVRTFGNALARTVDPAIVRRLQATGKGFQSWASSFRAGPLAMNRAADEIGRALAGTVNRAAAALPSLRGLASGLRESLGAALVGIGPHLRDGAASLQALGTAFVGSKVQAVHELATAIAEFGSRASTAMSPALAAAISLVGTSFSTLAAGAETVGRILAGVQGAFTGFATGLLGAISPDSLSSAGRGLAGFADVVAEPVRRLGEGFREISAAVSGANTAIASFAAAAGAGLGSGLNAIASIVVTAAGTISAALERVVAAVAAAKSALSSFSMPSLPTPSLFGGPKPAPAGIPRPSILGGSAPLPRRAGGGAVRRGPYLVGERGPEVVHMGGNGYVTPNHRLPAGGGSVMNNTFNITSSDPKSAATEVRRQLERFASRSQQTGINR